MFIEKINKLKKKNMNYKMEISEIKEKLVRLGTIGKVFL